MEAMKRDELLKKHQYKIWQGKDGKWYTYLPDESKKDGRRLIKRIDKAVLEDIVVEYCRKEEKVYLKDIFEEWVSQKLEYGEIQKQTYDRYKTDFRRFFTNSDISKKDIRKITEDDLELFVRNAIKNLNLTNKSYSGLRLLLIGVFI